MQKISKEQVKNFAKWFMVFWMSAVALSPYFLVSMSVMFVNFELGSNIFHYLFNFVSLPTIVVVLLLFRKKLPLTSGIKEFIALNARKFFFYWSCNVLFSYYIFNFY